MSGCGHAVEYIYRYLDDELTFAHKARVRVHLKRCANCTSAFDFETMLKKRIAEGGKSEPPQELFDTLAALIEQERNTEDPDC